MPSTSPEISTLVVQKSGSSIQQLSTFTFSDFSHFFFSQSSTSANSNSIKLFFHFARCFYWHRVCMLLPTSWHTFSALRKLFHSLLFLSFVQQTLQLWLERYQQQNALHTRNSESELIVEIFNRSRLAWNERAKMFNARMREKPKNCSRRSSLIRSTSEKLSKFDAFRDK